MLGHHHAAERHDADEEQHRRRADKSAYLERMLAKRKRSERRED